MGFLDRFKRDKPMNAAELGERSKVDGIKYRELQVVAQLVKMGADLKAPRHTLFFVYFATEAAARTAANKLESRGLTAQVRGPEFYGDTMQPADPFKWGVVAESPDTPLIPDFLRDTVDLCEALADELGGEYDGWEAGPDLEQSAAGDHD